MGKVQFEDALRFLDVVGSNPQKKDFWSRFRLFFAVTTVTTIAFLGLLELVFNYKGLDTLSRASESMIVQYQLLQKIFILLTSRTQLSKLIKNSGDFWDFKSFDLRTRKRMERIHTNINVFFRIYKLLMVLMTLQYILRKVVNRNALPLAITYGETDGFSPATDHAVFVFHSVGTVTVLHFIVGMDGLFFFFVGHVLTEVKLVSISFGNGRRNLVESIRHHQFVLDYIRSLNEVYSNMLLNQHVSCLFGICFGLFLLSKDGTPPDLAHITKYLPYIVSFITQTFTFCFIGSLIADWTVEVSDAIFYAGWTNGEAYRQKHEKIVGIRRAQKAVRLTLGRFGDLNLESFRIVIKNAFSFYTFINGISEEMHQK